MLTKLKMLKITLRKKSKNRFAQFVTLMKSAFLKNVNSAKYAIHVKIHGILNKLTIKFMIYLSKMNPK